MKKLAVLPAALLLAAAAIAQGKPPRDTITGNYRLRYSNVSNTLNVQKLPGGHVKLLLVALLKTGGSDFHNGEVRATLPLRENTAVYKEDSCRLDFRFARNQIIVRERNVGDCGFGAFVTAQGTYRKVSTKPVFTP